MKNQHTPPPRRDFFVTLLGEPTRAKASGAAFSLAAILPQVFALAFFVFTAGSLSDGEQPDWYLYFNYLIPQISFVFVVWFFFSYTKTPIKSALEAQKCPIKYYFIALFLQLGLLSLSALNGWFLELLGEFGYTDSGISLPSMQGFGFVGVLVVVAVLPAVLEETLFRCILLDGLHTFGKTGSIFLCGALFALYHQNPAQTIYQFCSGAAFALMALRAGSILPTVLAHFLNNAVILILTKCGVEEFSQTLQIIFLIVSALSLVCSLAYLIFFDTKEEEKALRQETAERKRFWVMAAAGIAMCVITWVLVLASGM